MAVRIFDALDFSDSILSANLVVVDGIIKCRKTDLNGDYDPIEGTYKSGTVLFPNLKLEALDSYSAFFDNAAFPIGDDSSETSITYQLSNDGGTTFFYFDSIGSPGGWTEAIDDSLYYSTLCEIDSNLTTFPFGTTKQIQVRACFNPSNDLTATPLLQSVALSYEIDIDHVEDFARTFHRYLNAYVRVRELQAVTVNSKNKVTIPTTLEITTPIKVFNLTTDPGKTINLYQSFSGKIITLISNQTGIVQVEYRAKVPNFLGAESFFQQSKLPSIAVQILGNEEDLQLTGGHKFEYELKKCDFTIKKRRREATQKYSILLSCQSDSEREAQAIADNVHQVLRTYKIVSDLTGNVFTVLDPINRDVADQIEVNLAVKNVVVGIVGRALMPVGTETIETIVQRVQTSVDGFVVAPVSNEISSDVLVPDKETVLYLDRQVITDENT